MLSSRSALSMSSFTAAPYAVLSISESDDGLTAMPSLSETSITEPRAAESALRLSCGTNTMGYSRPLDLCTVMMVTTSASSAAMAASGSRTLSAPACSRLATNSRSPFAARPRSSAILSSFSMLPTA
ncbi:MAG: hypothetical protein BWY85_02236 [Firmicutes bacterium ADurb.Bin506]|nr:MAG: hypothetical protein BWY85_02236 [Firmicutes bacterium ADurb.Bin506]